jgi:drug/metabolite transporter (DMT)-like permease
LLAAFLGKGGYPGIGLETRSTCSRKIRRSNPPRSARLRLAEVLFAVLYAWLLLGQMPSPAEITGGALMLTGVILIRAEDTRPSAPT